MRVPSDSEILRLHEKHAPTAEALDLVYPHCEIVCAIAEQLDARGRSGTDIELVRAGALLHDIGVYRLYDGAGLLDHGGYIRHGILGFQLLAEEGFPERLCRFASRHTGVGLSRQDVARQGLPLPPADYLAETGEETLVMYADKFHSKTSPPVFLTADAYASRVRRFGADKVAAFEEMRARFGEPDLAALHDVYGHQVTGGGRGCVQLRHSPGSPGAVRAALSSPDGQFRTLQGSSENKSLFPGRVTGRAIRVNAARADTLQSGACPAASPPVSTRK